MLINGKHREFEKESTNLIFKEDRLKQLEEDKRYLKEELEQAIKIYQTTTEPLVENSERLPTTDIRNQQTDD